MVDGELPSFFTLHLYCVGGLPVSGTINLRCGTYHVAESLEREARAPRNQQRDLNASTQAPKTDARRHGQNVTKATRRDRTDDLMWRDHA